MNINKRNKLENIENTGNKVKSIPINSQLQM